MRGRSISGFLMLSTIFRIGLLARRAVSDGRTAGHDDDEEEEEEEEDDDDAPGGAAEAEDAMVDTTSKVVVDGARTARHNSEK